MNLSKIGLSIAASPTLALNQRAAALRAKGEKIIHFGIGEPKSRAPIDAILSASNLLNSGEVRYTPSSGIPALKAAIVRYTEQHYGRTVTPQNVIASGGAKQSIMVALQAILDPGDEVLFPVPYWVSYPEMTRICGGVPVPVPVDTSGGTFEPRVEDFEKAMGPRTRAVILNSPNNPTGAMLSARFVEGIVHLCESKGVWLLMDDIYHQLVFSGQRWVNACEYASKLDDDSQLVIINGVSKLYAMTGFRIGWTVAARPLVQVMDNVQSHQTSGPSAVLQQAAVGALTGPQSSVEALKLFLQNNRDTMVSLLKTVSGVRVFEPQGTFYCFSDFSAIEKESRVLAEKLLDKVRVVTVPGVEFGAEGWLRMSFCGSIGEVREGVERIRWALDPESPREIVLGGCKLVRDWA